MTSLAHSRVDVAFQSAPDYGAAKLTQASGWNPPDSYVQSHASLITGGGGDFATMAGNSVTGRIENTPFLGQAAGIAATHGMTTHRSPLSVIPVTTPCNPPSPNPSPGHH